ncbi:MAG: hypothetical protein AABY26_04710 [Nanoarchaeota archaeon]
MFNTKKQMLQKLSCDEIGLLESAGRLRDLGVEVEKAKYKKHCF